MANYDPADSTPVDTGNLSSLQTETGLVTLKRRVVAGTAAYAMVGLVAVISTCFVTLRHFLSWLDTLPPNAEPSWDLLLADQPDLLVTAGCGGAVGVLLAGSGMVMWRRILGSEHWPPRKVLVTLTLLPLVLTVMGLVTSGSSHGMGAVLIVPIAAGYALATVPLQIGVLAMALLNLALKQLRTNPTPIEGSDLPRNVARYFDELEATALQAGLTPLGDFSFRPDWNRYRRSWMAPNGAYFVEANWARVGKTTLRAIGVCSATSDGHYFETVGMARIPGFGNQAAGEGGNLAHIDYLPQATLETLINRHTESVTDWVCRSGCRPLEFAASELPALAAYGIAAHMQLYQNDFLWLGNPYIGRPLPPLPGTPWQPAAEEKRESLVSW